MLTKTSKNLIDEILSYKLGKRGFTVLEMMVVAAIMAVLLAVSIANFRGFETSQVLETETERVASILRQAQIWALVGQTSGSTRYSFGVHLEECPSGSCAYILFKDLNSNNFYDVGEQAANAKFDLIKGTYINSLSPQSAAKLDIVFEPPLGNIYFNNSIDDNEAQIILGNALASQTKTITINRQSGQISIE